jgi:hypothetical protein
MVNTAYGGDNTKGKKRSGSWIRRSIAKAHIWRHSNAFDKLL